MARTQKNVISRTPAQVNVEINAMPTYESDNMCRVLLRCVSKYFENPENKAKYEAWLAERRASNQ